MVERALDALRFSKNAILKNPPFEAHHGREANTVLRNLTKKPSLQTLDWSRVIKKESACLDAADPNAQNMPHPADTNWSVRSDLAYDINHRSQARRLTDDQSANQPDEPSILKPASSSGQPGPSGLLFQRTGNRNLKRYKQLHSKVKSEITHTLTLNNGVVLRKLGVATKPKSKKSKATSRSVLPVPPPTSREVKERASHSVLPPPTPREVKERATQRIVSDRQRKKTGRRFENSGSESEESDDLLIISVKQAKQPSTETPRAQTGQTARTATDMDIGSDQVTIPTLGGDLDKNPRDQTTSNPGDQTHATSLPGPSKKKGPTTRKARLVSYSSQGDSQDETLSTTSRKSEQSVTLGYCLQPLSMLTL